MTAGPIPGRDVMNIHTGDTFGTPYERGCVALEEPDEYGNFLATDSDGVECAYSTSMVTAVLETGSER